MLAGSFDWDVAPPLRPKSPTPDSPQPREFTPAPPGNAYHKPPRARAQPRRVKPDPVESDSLHSGDVRELIGVQKRRAPTVQTLHDPGLRRVAGPLSRPKAKNMSEKLSEDPTARLQKMLRNAK
jgi:hypothetical protein